MQLPLFPLTQVSEASRVVVMANTKRKRPGLKNPHRDKSLKDDPAVSEIPLACASEPHAVEFLEQMRGWDDNAACVHCGSSRVYKMQDAKTGGRNKRFLWRCRDCQKQYTVRVGTVMEDSRIALRHWVLGFWRVCSSKKGVSALELRRQTGITHKSALFLLHRIRWAIADDGTTILGGSGKTIEADETYVGGKPRHPRTGNQGTTKKQIVFAVVERGGGVRMRPIERVSSKEVGSALMDMTDRRSRLMTDEHGVYEKPGRTYDGGHESVSHKKREYARGDAFSNTAESVFSILKRGLDGIYHSVSKRHLHRYLSEYEYRWNTRQDRDSERMRKAVLMSEGKRLTYQEPLSA